jgi:tetratricopeptide (TPR) repeat protein
VAWTIGFAKTQPLVMATEDLHWADASTLEFIQLAVEQGAIAPLMLLHTARPEFRIQWPMRSHHTQLTLNRLSARHVRAMVGQVAAQKALSEDTIGAVIERTSGVPLFVEELTRAVLETGGGASFSSHEIPVTLHDSLMARLDRLGPAKEILQIGSVIGSEFFYELLQAVHPIPEEALQRALLTLSNSDLLYVHGVAPDSTYLFKHALIRDVAYEALLKTRRKELHRRVARTIDEKFPALKEAHPEVLARHWTEASEVEPAIFEWTRAAKAAEIRSAFKEALESYEQALTCLSLLPEPHERDSRELSLRRSVISILNVTRGYAAPETIKAVDAAIALAEKIGRSVELISLLVSRGSTLLVSGDLRGANEIGDRTLKLAMRENSSSATLASLHQQLTIVLFWRGDLESAEEHFRAWFALASDLDLKQPSPIGTLLNTSVNALAFGSFIAWLRGQPNVAREREAQMLALAKQGSTFELANSGYLTGALYFREYQRAEALARQAIALAEKHQLPNPAARSRAQLGAALAHLGRAREGVALIQRAQIDLGKIGTRMGITLSMTRLAEAQELAGDITGALESLEIALRILPDEIAIRPETLRLRGELRLKQGELDLAEGDFRDAIALAQKMSAKAWELRATTSLARLFASQGHGNEVRTMLAEIYGSFTEGFDTADLKDAKALLDELTA